MSNHTSNLNPDKSGAETTAQTVEPAKYQAVLLGSSQDGLLTHMVLTHRETADRTWVALGTAVPIHPYPTALLATLTQIFKSTK